MDSELDVDHSKTNGTITSSGSSSALREVPATSLFEPSADSPISKNYTEPRKLSTSAYVDDKSNIGRVPSIRSLIYGNFNFSQMRTRATRIRRNIYVISGVVSDSVIVHSEFWTIRIIC
jgi:hypothetical protein